MAKYNWRAKRTKKEPETTWTCTTPGEYTLTYSMPLLETSTSPSWTVTGTGDITGNIIVEGGATFPNDEVTFIGGNWPAEPDNIVTLTNLEAA